MRTDVVQSSTIGFYFLANMISEFTQWNVPASSTQLLIMQCSGCQPCSRHDPPSGYPREIRCNTSCDDLGTCLSYSLHPGFLYNVVRHWYKPRVSWGMAYHLVQFSTLRQKSS